MKKYLSIFISLLILILPCWALGATYYVTQNGSGIGDGSLYANSMSVSAHNSGKFIPGDTIYLCDTITDDVDPPSDGASGNRITYRGDEAGHAGILDTATMRISGIDYLYIQDLTFINDDIGICSLGSSDYITIKRCTIHNMETKGIFISYSTKYYKGHDPLTWNTNITIGGAPGDGNDIYDCGVDTGGQDISLLKVHDFTISYNKLYGVSGGVDGIATHRSYDGVIEYNEIHDHAREDGIDIKNASYNLDIRYNHIYNHTSQTGITVQFGSHDVNIYGNRIHNNKNNIMVYARPYGDVGNVYNVSIWSNEVYSSVSTGIAIIKTGEYRCYGIKIYNNTIAGNATTPTDSNQTGLTLYGIIAGDATSEVKDNVFYNNRPNESDYRQVYAYDEPATVVTFSNNRAYWPSQTSKVYWGADGTEDFTSAKVGSNNTEDPALKPFPPFNFRVRK